MGFRPLHDWVLIKRSLPEERTIGGIIIPDAARSKPTEGIVEAIGPGRLEKKTGEKEKKFIPTVLMPGQRVIFIDYMTREIELDGQVITVIQEDNILGFYEGAGALTIKEQYHVEVRQEHPPMVQAEKEKHLNKKRLEVEVTFKKASKKGKTVKQIKTEPETKKKPAAPKKEKQMKKTEKKAAPAKKAAADKAVKKTAAKKTAKKAVPKKSVKKATVKETPAKKAAPPKKTAAKKSAVKKVAASAGKTSARKTSKKATAKKK